MPDTLEAPTKLKPRHDVFTLSKVRNLYLFQDLAPVLIAKECGVTVKAVYDMVSRHGWSKEKRERLSLLTKKHDARMAAMNETLVEVIASHAEQHSIRALQKTGEALERNDRDAAKDAQAYSATVKNLVGVAKTIREPVGGSAIESAPTQINLFFAGAGSQSQANKSDPKPVEPIDVKSVT